MFRLLIAWLTIVAVFAATACQKGIADPKPFPVEGRVLLNGKPLSDAAVTFHPMGGLPPSQALKAMTDASGRYRLSFREGRDGAPEGEYAVSIVYLELRRDGGEDVRNGRNLLARRYADPETSTLWAVVKPQPNELPPFQLTD